MILASIVDNLLIVALPLLLFVLMSSLTAAAPVQPVAALVQPELHVFLSHAIFNSKNKVSKIVIVDLVRGQINLLAKTIKTKIGCIVFELYLFKDGAPIRQANIYCKI